MSSRAAALNRTRDLDLAEAILEPYFPSFAGFREQNVTKLMLGPARHYRLATDLDPVYRHLDRHRQFSASVSRDKLSQAPVIQAYKFK